MKSSELIFKEIQFTREDFKLEVNKSFQAGKLTVILGPSGSGKTTLLDLAAGFLKPDSGRIFEGNVEVTSLSPEKRRVGVVFQDHALFSHLSVRANVEYGPRVRGESKRRAGEIADRFLEMTRISQYSDKRPSLLSGGEKQRVALARALAIEPEILLLDEPFSSLDASLRRSMRNEVRNIQKEIGITTVLVTHDQEEALSLADYLAVMREGKIVQMGKPADLWKNPTDLFTALFLGNSTHLRVHRIIPENNSYGTVETAAGLLRIKNSKEMPLLPATVIIRPEDLHPSPQGPIRGFVKNIEYSGEFWKITLSVPPFHEEDSDVVVYNISGIHPPAIGEQIRLKYQSGSVKILHGRAP